MTARRTGIASVATLAALTLTVGVVHAVAPEWAERVGVDVWNLSALEADRARSVERRHDLEVSGEVMLRQIEVSDRLVGELVAGRLSLADAVAELGRVNANRTGFLAYQRFLYPDAGGDRELMARYAMTKAARILRDDPSHQAEVVCRLAAEYRDLVGKVWPGNN